MFFEILLFTVIGIFGGVISGLTPGIHTNTLILLLFGILPFLSGFPVHAVVALIISMTVTNTIVDFIPSIFLGAPEDDTALSVLPGHKMLLEGKGLEAIYLSIVGGIGVVILFVLMIPILLKVLPFVYESVKYYTHWLLSLVILFMILIEKGKKKIWGCFIVLLSGVLGIITFNNSLMQPQFMFFPLFSGLFGISTLLISLKDKTKLPNQIKSFGVVEKSLAIAGIIKGFFSGLIVGILPGVGSAQAGVLVQQVTRKENIREFLISLGGINTANAIFSLTALYAIGRPRSGSAVAVQDLLENFGLNDLILLIAVSLITVGLASIATLFISKKFLSLVERVPYNRISIAIIALLVLLTIVFTGPIGFLVLFVSTAIGMIPPLIGVKRSLCMAVLIVPVILFYAGL